MSNHVIKWIAIITMTIDHIGVYMIAFDHPLHIYARLIGRLAFPLFAFLIAEGFRHTKDIKKYMLRLLIFAASIEIVMFAFYALFFTSPSVIGYFGESLSFNIFWTLLFGLVALYLFHHEEKDMKVMILPLLVLSLFVQYSFYGVLLILMFGAIKTWRWQMVWMVPLTLLYVIHPVLLFGGAMADVFWVQLFALAAMIPIYFYNGKRGKQIKYFFYLYYPVHILILYGLGQIFYLS